MTKLGTLRKIELRNIWQTEDQDFTPWLAGEDNIQILGDTLGIELEVEAQEKEVGPFRADILCKNLLDDSWVLIENQLEKTDHKHLGQILTYAAGLKAVTIVWIAQRFTDEHRATLDWLNQVTEDKFQFFGLEVELWQIGDSAAAPKFNVVSKPNEWSRVVGAATKRIENEALTDTKKLQLKYWTELNNQLQSHPSLRMQKPRPQHWTNIPIGRSGMRLGAIINTRENYLAIELYLGDENALAYFSELEQDKSQIESELGYQLDWKPLPDKRASRIIHYLPNASLDSENRWKEYRSWMIQALEDFNRVFRHRVKKLDPESFEAEMDGGIPD